MNCLCIDISIYKKWGVQAQEKKMIKNLKLKKHLFCETNKVTRRVNKPTNNQKATHKETQKEIRLIKKQYNAVIPIQF